MGPSKGFSRKNPDQAVPSISLTANSREWGLVGTGGGTHGSLFPNSPFPEKDFIILSSSKPRASTDSKGPVQESGPPQRAEVLTGSHGITLIGQDSQKGTWGRDTLNQTNGEGSEKAARQHCYKTNWHMLTSLKTDTVQFWN